jgi:heme/copper-type cytochrome/quinol oxidase subunit 3
MDEAIVLSKALPVGSAGHRASGWWGMWCLIATEAALFAYLIFAYFYLGAQAQTHWVPEVPKLKMALPNTILLLASSAVLYWGETAIRRNRRGRLSLALAITFFMGSAFAAVQALEWRAKEFRLWDSAYASTYYVTTGFHMAHVIGGLLMIAMLLAWSLMGKFDQRRHAAVSIGALYWHFVDVVWLAVFTVFYLTPRWTALA